MRLSFYTELGYSSEEIDRFCSSISSILVELLEANHYCVGENVKCLQGHIDRHLLLQLPFFYPVSFCTDPELFTYRIDLLKEAFPDSWSRIITKQTQGCWGIKGLKGTNYKPFLEVIALRDEDVQRELDLLQHPEEIIFEFMVMLGEIGIEVDPDSLYDNIVWDMEASKLQILKNALMLLSKGLDRYIISDIIGFAPLLMTLSEMEVQMRLRKGFGEDYITKMSVAYEDETFEDIIEKIGW